MKIEKIETIKKRFKNEWLLIKVGKVEDSKPITGSLIDHSQDKTIIFKEIGKYNSKYPVLVTYSQDDLPQGYAAAFNIDV